MGVNGSWPRDVGIMLQLKKYYYISLQELLILGDEERRLMDLVPALAVRLMKRRVLSRPGVYSLLPIHEPGLAFLLNIKFLRFPLPFSLSFSLRKSPYLCWFLKNSS